jgi:D-3-phosphoglycerate dehydrogenase / 2-oxoglutarate reductase
MKSTDYVLLPQPIEEDALALLTESGIDYIITEDTEKSTVYPLLRSASAVILRTGFTMDREAFEAAESLKIVSRTGAGYDNVNVKAATEQGIIVTSSIGVNSESVAEHCLALLLTLYKELFRMDKAVRENNFKIRYKNYPRDLQGKTLGIVGFGKIGSILADKCRSAFFMKVLAYDPFIGEEKKTELQGLVEFTSLKELFSRSDAVSIHIPLTEQTKNLINIDLLQSMKKDAVLINAARGGVVNEADLADVLRKGLLRGAGIDVFSTEPPAEDNPLLPLDSVILSPHSAALTAECVLKMATSAAQRVIDVISGSVPDNVINPEALSLEGWKDLRR